MFDVYNFNCQEVAAGVWEMYARHPSRHKLTDVVEIVVIVVAYYALYASY
jgi:hypothetical protein